MESNKVPKVLKAKVEFSLFQDDTVYHSAKVNEMHVMKPPTAMRQLPISWDSEEGVMRLQENGNNWHYTHEEIKHNRNKHRNRRRSRSHSILARSRSPMNVPTTMSSTLNNSSPTMIQRTTIHRPLPSSMTEKVSILFSHYFGHTLMALPIQNLLQQVNWRLGIDGPPDQRLFPPVFTEEAVFPTAEVDQMAKYMLTNWEYSNNKAMLQENLTKFLRSSHIFRLAHEVVDQMAEDGLDLEIFIDFFNHVWFQSSLNVSQGSLSFPSNYGFKHVFIGEIKNVVKGLHSWQRLYLLEKNNKVKVNKVIRKSNSFHLAGLNFNFGGVEKPYGSLFFGLPMDFEMTFLFMAFLLKRNGPIVFMLLGNPITIESYDLNRVDNAMATAFFKY